MADANENEELEEKKDKKKKKEKKKEAPNLDADGNEIEEPETLGSKIVLFIVTLLIIVIWLGIIAVLVKSDVGGFGSSVLKPLIKDVPYLNMILPDSGDIGSTENDKYNYSSVEEAVKRIKELELEIDELTTNGTANSDTIAELKEEINKLSVYKQEQAEFEKLREKFYEEVVFSNNAPDIEEYKAYYESIYPENAEVLYKQVLQQLDQDEKTKQYAQTYSSMKPKEAAAIFDTMTKDLDLVADILMAMDTESRAKILGKMNSDTAAKVTKIMEP